MKTKYLFLAALTSIALVSCMSDEIVGDNSPNNSPATITEGINFGFKMPNATRANIAGPAAADLLGKHFYVMGTKGTGESSATEPAKSPTTNLVFDNYLVEYRTNSAGTTESNTANWEYVGVQPAATGYEDYVYLTSASRTTDAQTIKYWDYSTDSYDFFAFSTGKGNKAVATASATTNQVGVTNMQYGDALKNGATAYTLTIKSVDDLAETYITDIKKVEKANYKEEVQLQFKNIGAKIRVALYETIPGYSVKNVKFYASENSPIDHNSVSPVYVAPTDDATLINASATGFTTDGSIAVSFPYVGWDNRAKEAYDKADAQVTPNNGVKTKTFGELTTNQLKDREKQEDALTGDAGKLYLGRSLPEATFAGDENADFYKPVFPAASTTNALTLRVDYTLVSIDGTKEAINVYGANAVVPATYTQWKPNYAYTYIFKISDNTNGWTDEAGTAVGLFPITFDAVVTEATDVTGEQRTVTTVATPSITTYQQYHKTNANEYSQTVKNLNGDDVTRDIYVQVMDNSVLPSVLIGTTPASSMPLLNTNAKEGIAASRLMKVTATPGTAISEATVMDALLNRTSEINVANVTGRNGITLTNDGNIDNTVTSIINGVDDNPIEEVNGAAITEGQVAKINIAGLTASSTYAYVYDYTGASTAKNVKTIWQFIPTESGTTVVEGYEFISNTDLGTWDAGATTEPTHYTAGNEDAAENYLYFSITTNGGATTTYSFVNVDDKIGTPLPNGLLKLPSSELDPVSGTGVTAAADTFYFTTYKRNDGKYGVKVILIE